MTIEKARKILGKVSESMTDEEIERDINTAIFLKEVFFGLITKENKPCINLING